MNPNDDKPIKNSLEQQLLENRRREQLKKKQRIKGKLNEDTLIPQEEDQGSELFADFGKDNIEVEESLNNAQTSNEHNTRESVFDSGVPPTGAFKNRSKSGNPQTSTQLLIAQKKAALQKEMEANKKLLQATQKLKQFQRMAFSPVKDKEYTNVQSINDQMHDSIDRLKETSQ